MSKSGESSNIPRRAFHGYMINGVAVGITAASRSSSARCDEPAIARDDESATEAVNNSTSTGDRELQQLIDGNQRFVSGKLKHPHLGNHWRKRLSSGQKPFATILGCSDSRVPPELLFDQGFGDLFVIRIAGNVVDTDVTGSVEYGVDHLSTRLVVVMGHDGCGAVTAALSSKSDLAKEPKAIRSLVGRIQPAISQVDEAQKFSTRLKQSVEANVRASVRQLTSVPDLQKAIAANKTKIIGCVYDIKTGQVRTLDV